MLILSRAIWFTIIIIYRCFTLLGLERVSAGLFPKINGSAVAELSFFLSLYLTLTLTLYLCGHVTSCVTSLFSKLKQKPLHRCKGLPLLMYPLDYYNLPYCRCILPPRKKSKKICKKGLTNTNVERILIITKGQQPTTTYINQPAARQGGKGHE